MLVMLETNTTYIVVVQVIMRMWCFGENHFSIPPWALTYAPYGCEKTIFQKSLFICVI